jgi:Kef-type K+ transport system membrane component KefB
MKSLLSWACNPGLMTCSNALSTHAQGFSSSDNCLSWQAVACIGVIIAGGRTLLRPIYRRMADMGNTDVFAATTLLVVLGTSVLTQIAGLSLALGAFLVSFQLL